MIEVNTTRRSSALTFSMKNLLMITALIALGMAIGIAKQRNSSLKLRRETLELLPSDSARLKVSDIDELVAAEQVKVVPNVHTWIVHVPEGREYKICLGAGELYSESIPLPFDSVSIPSGKHRVTLVRGDSVGDEFRYSVYVDGVQVIEKAMGSQWMPEHWYSTNNLVWPRGHSLAPAPLNLLSQTYNPQTDFEPQFYTSYQIENYVTRKGFRLWIDLAGRTYTTNSPFIGFIPDESYNGIGLRDGLRYLERSLSHVWAFTLPASGTWESILQIEPVFYTSDGQFISAKDPSFIEWQLSDNAESLKPVDSLRGQDVSSLSVFLHATAKTDQISRPVIELKWDASRLDEIGLRLADTPSNKSIERWGLRVRDGTEHLWREIQFAGRTLTATEVIQSNNGMSKDENILIPLESIDERLLLQWQTNETLPVNSLKWSNKQYDGYEFYQGRPKMFSLNIPRDWASRLAVRIINESPKKPGDPFPGGAIYSEIQLDFSTADRDWLWLKVKPKP